jgi:hypothetical protein
MDIQSLIYFTESVKDLNFTSTAKRLFISQQNLSNHIARLEQYYDVKLFERKPKLALTYSGEVLYSYAKHFKMEEENLKTLFSDIKQKERGILNIGVSPSRTSIIAPVLAEIFADKYPNVELHYFHHHSNTLTEMLLDGRLDFLLGVDKIHHASLESHSLFKDSIYVIISEKLIQKYKGDSAEDFIKTAVNGVEIKDIVDIPFINIRSTNITKDCFKAAGIEPKFPITSNYPQFFMPNYYASICASIITETVLLHIQDTFPASIHIFPLKTHGKVQLNDISLTQHKQKILSAYGNHYVDVAKQYFSDLSQRSCV